MLRLRAPTVTTLALIAVAGCATPGRYGAIDASCFVPLTTQQLELALGDVPTPGPNSSNQIFDGKGQVVTFPAERATYATEVVDYHVGIPAPLPEGQDPRAALGPPDYHADRWASPREVTLGNGGSITLGFANALADGDGPDVFIFEVGPSVEGMFVDVSADAKTWISAGEVRGGACAVDIGPYVDPGDLFRYVRLRDIPHQGGESDSWPGADIDAVAIVGSARRVAVPSEVLFDFDSDSLGAGAPAELDRIVVSIPAVRRAYVRLAVEGFTDDVGAPAYNQQLSERRAGAVAAYLAGRGIPPARITTRGYGAARPVGPNDTDENRRRNRRVEILIGER